ncbi:MAG: sugar phosphate nucleotidyltransferase [Spirochaetia bacterium]
MDYSNVLSIILGGGRGSRLYPLTEQRAKPALPFGGKYRLIDAPISNCMNAGLRKIFVLSHFKSASLHNYINLNYSFDRFFGGFIDVLAADQIPENETLYTGTANAVRKNLPHFHIQNPDYYLILSGDQIYRINIPSLLETHKKVEQDLTIASIPVTREQACNMGILRIDRHGVVRDFLEKPKADRDISFMKIPAEYMSENQIPEEKEYLASIGIYVFNRGSLEKCLDNDKTDFGAEVIPESIGQVKMGAFLHQGYWEDVSSIKSFYAANIDLTTPKPNFDLYDPATPLFAKRWDLPPGKMNSCNVYQSITADGSVIIESTIRSCIIGPRAIIQAGSTLEGVCFFGAEFYETPEQQKENVYRHIPNVGVGTATVISKTIIDQNARIGNNCRIGVDPIHRKDGDYGAYIIKEGIIVIRKNGIIPNGTII